MIKYDELTNMPCVSTAGLSASRSDDKYYLGSGVNGGKPLVNLTLKALTKEESANFDSFYVTDINYGYDEFSLILTIFGVTAEYYVTIEDGYSSTPTLEDTQLSDITLTVKLNSSFILPEAVVSRTSEGSCEYSPGNDCEALSSYSVSLSEGSPTSYAWSISGLGAFISGPSTMPTCQVSSDTDQDVNFTITCEVSYTGGSVSDSLSDTHTRTEFSGTSKFIHIAFNQTTPPQNTSNEDIDPPAGVTVNQFLVADTDSAVDRDLYYADGSLSSSLKLRFDDTWSSTSKASITGDESDALSDIQMVNAWVKAAASGDILVGFLVEGDYVLTASTATGQTEEYDISLNNITKHLIGNQPQKSSVSFSVSTDELSTGFYTFRVAPTVGSNCRINGITIEELL